MSDYPFPIVPCNKSEWPSGPWKGSEPDSVSWPAHGLTCAMIRHSSMGHWCGYVHVPDDHPLRHKEYNERAPIPKAWLERKMRVDEYVGVISLFCLEVNTAQDLSEATLDLIFFCHGDLTYSHDGWFGFDCAHSGDVSPGMQRFDYDQFSPPFNYVYKDFSYVRAQCERLAQQLAEYPEALAAQSTG